MPKITVLPDHVANQIAAGEVVQRPASVVKELLENAVDAGATRVELSLLGAGKTAITVVDNGSGMDSTDAENCFTRHATSKIKSAEDLFNLHTRGFRGEALASIAAVAHVVLRTHCEEEDLGWEVRLEDSQVQSKVPIALPKGTTVTVKNLFYNVPARRKFLKNDRIELRHCIDEFQRVALVHTEIEWVMKSEGTLLFQLRPEPMRRRIAAIFGRKYDEKLVPISESTEVVRLSGFVLKPEFAKKKRGEQFFFVNGRYIKSPYLHNAVREAFEEVLTAEHHPGYFLHLEVDPSGLDVNIHPTKTEVKFEDERAIYAVLRSAARHAIGQFNVAPSLDFEAEQSFSVPPLPAGRMPQPPQIQVNPYFNPFETTEKPATPHRAVNPHFDRLSAERALNNAGAGEGPDLSEEIAAFWSNESSGELGEWAPREAAQTDPIFKWGDYLVTPLQGRLLLIDIRGARYRILFDQLWSRLEESTVPSQQLLFPQSLDFGLADAAIVSEYQGLLATAGFDLNAGKNPGSYELVGVPMMLEAEAAVPALERFIEDLHELGEEAQTSTLHKALAKHMAAQAARGAAPKTVEEWTELKAQLLSSSNPQYSPSGQKIIKELTLEDVKNLS